MHGKSKAVAVAVALAALAMACDSGEEEPRSQGSPPLAAASEYRPDIDPSDFVAVIDNPLYPLVPGSVFRLRGETEDGPELNVVRVTDRTKEILGVTTTVVKDVVKVDGELAELTYDWYAQDRDGNVWYFGEDTAEYEDGKVANRAGSWEAGVDGAQPGIVVIADPQVTDSYRQEFYEGEAEDMFWVVSVGGSKSVPYGDFDDVVHTLEWSPLEPKVVEEKFYAPGVGLLAEQSLVDKEKLELFDVAQP
jgi:hypothetical protein